MEEIKDLNPKGSGDYAYDHRRTDRHSEQERQEQNQCHIKAKRGHNL